MGKKIFLAATAALIVFTTLLAGRATAVSDYDGQVVKMEGLDTLYYVAVGQRYIFPNDKTYKTWFLDFEDITILMPSQISALPLAGNVRYRPGVLMVKITTDPKVYAVSRNGVLRWIKTEQIARKLYGRNWPLLVDDVPDSLFTNYSIGNPINNDSEYDPNSEVEDTDSINVDRGLALGHLKQAKTAKCRAIPTTPNGQGQPATPATPARECKLRADSDKDDYDDEVDTIEPTISGISATTTTSTATISWTIDELALNKIKYAPASLTTATTSDLTTLTATTTTAFPSFALTGLTASSTYYYKVWSTDLNANTASSSEATFTTLAE